MEGILDVDINVNHAMDTLTLMITSTLDEHNQNESWGVRDVYIFTEEVTEKTPTKPENPPFYEAFMTNSFTELDSWTAFNAQSTQYITSCGSDRMVGGYGVFGAQAVVAKQLLLPPHYKVSIKFKLYKIDNWANNFFFLYVDGVQLIKQQSFNAEGTQLCGNAFGGVKFQETVGYIELTDIPHNANSIEIFMTSTLNQNAGVQSWGFKEF